MKIYLYLLLATILVYAGSLQYGFSQDDFFFLLLSRADSLPEFLQFFSPFHQNGFPFYRPLSTQLYYFIFQPHALSMHIFMLALQAAAGYQVYRLTQFLTKDRTLPWLTALSYTVAGAHFLSLYYIAATQQIFSAFFSFFALNLFLRRRYLISGLMFALALLSKESAIVTPAIAFLLYFFHQRGPLTRPKLLPAFTPFGVVLVVYLLLRMLAGLAVQAEYTPHIGLSLVSSLRWYYLFTFNAPELLLNYSGVQLFVNYYRFVKDFGALAVLNSVSSLILSFTVLLSLIRSLVKSHPLNRRQILMYFQWWLLGIALIIWFPAHRYPHYLDLALPALLIPLYTSLKSTWRYFAFALFLVGAVSAVALSSRTHWTTGRAQMAKRVSEFLATQNLCALDALNFTGEGDSPLELSYTLSRSSGPQVLCANPDLQVFYQEAPAGVKSVDITKLVHP